jgi:hypothetical protein
MAVPRQTSPTGLRVTAIVLVLGGLIIGIGLPVLLAILKIKTTQVLPGIDLMLLICPAIGIVDLFWARFFWRRAAASDPERSGPVIG